MAGLLDIVAAADLQNKLGLGSQKCSDVVKAILQTIPDLCADGGRVVVKGFGTFTVRKKGAREGTNPRTGKKMPLRPSARLHFKSLVNLSD